MSGSEFVDHGGDRRGVDEDLVGGVETLLPQGLVGCGGIGVDSLRARGEGHVEIYASLFVIIGDYKHQTAAVGGHIGGAEEVFALLEGKIAALVARAYEEAVVAEHPEVGRGLDRASRVKSLL